MQSSKNGIGKPTSKVMLDFDGVAIDDITPHINKRFPGSDTGIARAFTEGLFQLLRPLKSAGAKLITQPEICIEQNAASFMRTRTPSDLILCTANPILEKNELNLALQKEGVHEARIYTVLDKDKIRIAKSENATLVEDDPIVAIMAAKEGVNVILFERKYNRSAGKILQMINKNRISTAHNWGDVAKLVGSRQ
jgi:hypothetical protein